ncbi:hypothetical protein Nepgr_014900 [Nepenthes gracilis]|uniref:Uncharacterized protein n=1 Tax=Nepenthes gracilis TaxID=150966 RepID=A0AAD3SLM9_NEPGR|nr:hypothetical protein Nepgr_014900 [Nepenthes gracilis]
MDEDIVRWVLEFLLRQPIDDSVINALLSVLPIANNDSRLKKTLLLRRIDTEVSDASVSEKIMELLEIVEELDHRDGKSASELMKAAYCAVAVDCTVRFLEDSVETSGKYLEAVKRIWRKKLSKMEKLEKNGGGLVSENLLRWRDDIEAAITDSIVRDKILMSNTRNEALKAVRAYLKESWESMGPSFLEYVVQTMSKMENKELGTGGEAMGDQLGKGVEKGVSACHKFVVSHNTAVDEGGRGEY